MHTRDLGWVRPTAMASSTKPRWISHCCGCTARSSRTATLISQTRCGGRSNGATYWSPESEALALKIAQEGIVLLKNKNDILPLTIPKDGNYTILMAGGWVNATDQMQGIYAGPARTLVSP